MVVSTTLLGVVDSIGCEGSAVIGTITMGIGSMQI
jgi:hypothetical protein